MRPILIPALALSLAACTAQPPAASAPPLPRAAEPAPLSELVEAVQIPFETFTLPNGLTTIIHTDRKAPIVGVTIYYRVGSKHEPRGRTGFAHLFEHLMFGGSENVPSFDKPLEAAGSTATNGSTWYDRTNYVETVPTGALDLALFMESDRMGHLLGAVTQQKLDRQRGVVQNEKRQGDNEPYGLVEYAISEGIFPVGHPYRHATIGSMADLDAASLADVHTWFRDNYGPNNVVLALTGDIDTASAQPLVERWFGHIPRGPEVKQPPAAPVTLPAPAKREMADQVPVIRLHRNWSGPGVNHPDAPALDVAMRVLGGLASSRLDNTLVRGEQLAVAVTAQALPFEQVSGLQATMDIKPGVERATAEARFHQLIAQYIAEGPSEDEVRRAATSAVSGQVSALERVGGFYGKGATLAEGQLYSGDPAQYRKELQRIASLTPADVRAAMQRWLTRPVYSLAVIPGQRKERGEEMGGWGDEGSASAAPARARPATLAPGPKRAAPPVAPVADLDMPEIERARLSNGIPVALARRTAVPRVLVNLAFDAGIAADAQDTPGTQALMLGMLDEGTTTRTATQIAEEQERLGADIEPAVGVDSSAVTLTALTPNLAPSLALMADVVLNPAFAAGEVARVKDQKLAELAQVLATPAALARREMTKVLFGPRHPYGQPADGLGDAQSLAALTPAALKGAHGEWLRPDIARLTVVGDVTMERLLPLLETAFGQWRAPAGPTQSKQLTAAIPAPRARIVLIDRPGSPQSTIMAGRVLPVSGTQQGLEELDLANEVLGGGFLSRINSRLREELGWSYGAYSFVSQPVGPRSFGVTAPVQTDKTGASIREILGQIRRYTTAKGVDRDELERVTEGNVRNLPNRFETNAQVLSAIVANERLGRPDDYYERLPARYRAIGAPALDGAARQWLGPDGLTFLVVGDRKAVEPQLKDLGLPVEVMTAESPPIS